jgi:hypothetical protein
MSKCGKEWARTNLENGKTKMVRRSNPLHRKTLNRSSSKVRGQSGQAGRILNAQMGKMACGRNKRPIGFAIMQMHVNDGSETLPRSDHLTDWGNAGAHIELDDEASRIRIESSGDEWHGGKGKVK